MVEQFRVEGPRVLACKRDGLLEDESVLMLTLLIDVQATFLMGVGAAAGGAVGC